MTKCKYAYKCWKEFKIMSGELYQQDYIIFSIQFLG